MTTATAPSGRRSARRLAVRPLEFAERSPVPVVAGIVALSALLLAYYTSQVSEWLVMTDELQYVKLSQSIVDTGSPLPALRGERYYAYNQLYPLTISPLLALLDMPAAFRAIHLLNALLFASTAIPGYLLGRGVGLGRGASYLVGALCVLVPWTALSIMVMTENVAYPAFVWALAAIQRAIARPSPRADLLALGAIALAALARTQFLLLAGVLPAAVLLHELGFRLAARRGGERPSPLRETLRRRAVLVGACVAGAALLAALAATGRLSSLLGSYRATIEEGELLPPGTWQSAEVHLAHVTVAIGVVPVVLALAWAAVTLIRPPSRLQHSLAVLGLVTVPLLALQVASFNIRFAGGNIQTRYLFYVCPLLFAGMGAALIAGRRVWLPAAAASVAVYLLVDLGAYRTALGPFFSAPETAFYKVLDGRSYVLGLQLGLPLRGDDTVPIAALALGLAASALLRLAPARTALAVAGVALVAGLAYETRYVIATMTQGFNGPRPVSGTSLGGRDWIDRATPGGAHAALLPLPLNAFRGEEEDRGYVQQQLWWDTEFWNKSVDRTYTLDEHERFTVFPTLPLTLDARTGRVDVEDQRPYVAVSGSHLRFGLAGDVVARDPTGYVELVRADRPYRAAWTTSDLGDTGWTGDVPAAIRLFPRAGRPTRHTLRLELGAPPDAARRYELRPPGGRAVRGRLAPGERRWTEVTACVAAPAELTVRAPAGTVPGAGGRAGVRVRQIRDALGPC